MWEKEAHTMEDKKKNKHMMLQALTLEHPENLYMRRWCWNG